MRCAMAEVKADLYSLETPANGDISLEDKEGRGRPSDFDDQALLTAVEEDESLTTRMLAEDFNVNQSSISDRSTPEEAWKAKRTNKKNLVTGDESWLLFNNVERKKICVSPGVSPKGIPKDVHCEKTAQKKNHIAFHHDNARPHVDRRVIESIANKGWDLLPHPPYSPTEAPTDYHVNRSLKNWQTNKVYDDLDDLVADVKASKNRDLFARGIDRLQSKWEAVLEVDGDYALE
ncbi:hypothetical protein RB195_019488 [Necator americanus]|uniref:Histone-lysine N-methyltransferase SETMAR n=1 Tax=Necator americanus TaxID=51031 RepID=A0ABR1CEE5_NECAM